MQVHGFRTPLYSRIKLVRVISPHFFPIAAAQAGFSSAVAAPKWPGAVCQFWCHTIHHTWHQSQSDTHEPSNGIELHTMNPQNALIWAIIFSRYIYIFISRFWQETARNWTFGPRWQNSSTSRRYLNACSGSTALQSRLAEQTIKFLKVPLSYPLIIKHSGPSSMVTTVTASWIGRHAVLALAAVPVGELPPASGNCWRLGVPQILQQSFKMIGCENGDDLQGRTRKSRARVLAFKYSPILIPST